MHQWSLTRQTDHGNIRPPATSHTSQPRSDMGRWSRVIFKSLANILCPGITVQHKSKKLSLFPYRSLKLQQLRRASLVTSTC